MTRSEWDLDISRAEYRERVDKLLKRMIISMHTDIKGKQRKQDSPGVAVLRKAAIADLRVFHDWPVFQKAMACGMTFPNEEQVQRYLDGVSV